MAGGQTGSFAIEATTYLDSDPANDNLQERITAGYVMNTVDLGSSVHLQAGLRIEATNEANTGYQVLNDSNGNYISTRPVDGGGWYIDFMPSVQLRYNMGQNSDLRAVFSRGILRPDPYDLVVTPGLKSLIALELMEALAGCINGNAKLLSVSEGLKLRHLCALYGTAEAVPFQNGFMQPALGVFPQVRYSRLLPAPYRDTESSA
jgi:hypothetical protein